MTTATSIGIAESTVPKSPTKPIENDEAAYLYFTPIPGTSIGVHNNALHVSPQNKKMTTPPTVPLDVALAAAHPNGSFDMEELGVEVSELGTHDELCIMNIFDREGHAFVLAPRVGRSDEWDCN